jgi:hypothetical protein
MIAELARYNSTSRNLENSNTVTYILTYAFLFKELEGS